MKLEGSLDAFSLPDIFQLLSYTKKTGGLRLTHAEAQGVVYFTDGAVTGAAADGGRQTLARRLVGLGFVDETAVVAAVEAVRASDTDAGVVATLVAQGAVSAADVTPVATAQLHDAVFELLRWPEGDFAFAVDEHDPDDVGLRLAPDEVVARATEQRERWDEAAERVPSPLAVPELVGSSEPETVVLAAEWAVLRLVDGRRSVAEIVDLGGAGQYATVAGLAALVERGLVRVRPSGAPDAVAETVRLIGLLAPVEARPGTAPRSEPRESEPAASVAAPEPAPSVAAEPVVPEAVDREKSAEPEPAVARERTPSTVVSVPDADADSADDADDADNRVGEPVGVGAPRARLGGAHVAGDVVPPREEPFIAPRRPAFAEPTPSRAMHAVASPSGANAATAQPLTDGLIERDPSVNRSLLLRLIAGVRGL